MLIRNARLVAVTEPVPGPVDVRLDGGRVVEVGAGLEARETSYDAGGRWLMPGLWDQHVHLGQWTLASARLDLAGARSSGEAVALVRERLEEWPDLPVIGWGHRPTAWPDNPAVSDLDALATDQPIVLIAGDGHHGWLNTTALHMLALPTRDSVVTEAEWFQAYGRLAAMVGSDGTSPEAYRRCDGGSSRAGRRGPGRPRVQRRGRRLGRPMARRTACCGSGTPATPTASKTSSTAASAPATRSTVH